MTLESIENKKETVSFSLNSDTIKKIEEIQFSNRIRSRSLALEKIIKDYEEIKDSNIEYSKAMENIAATVESTIEKVLESKLKSIMKNITISADPVESSNQDQKENNTFTSHIESAYADMK